MIEKNPISSILSVDSVATHLILDLFQEGNAYCKLEINVAFRLLGKSRKDLANNEISFSSIASLQSERVNPKSCIIVAILVENWEIEINDIH